VLTSAPQALARRRPWGGLGGIAAGAALMLALNAVLGV
jgi:hypothetical protein